MELINSIIGKQVYLTDNAYSTCLSNENIKFPLLAGDYETPAVLITIVSEPYNLKFIGKYSKYATERSFITVIYGGETYMVLDEYTETIEEPYKLPAIDDLIN